MKYVLCFVSRGIFNQGYLCLKCGLGAHKECLGRLGVCGRTGEIDLTNAFSSLASFSLDSLDKFTPLKFFLKFCDLYSSTATRSIFPLFHPKYQNLKGRLKWNLLSAFMYPRGAHGYALVAPRAVMYTLFLTTEDFVMNIYLNFCEYVCDLPRLKFAVEHTFISLSRKI